jgi:hypothetical protein
LSFKVVSRQRHEVADLARDKRDERNSAAAIAHAAQLYNVIAQKSTSC